MHDVCDSCCVSESWSCNNKAIVDQGKEDEGLVVIAGQGPYGYVDMI
jgi:hypothetical protein